MRSIAMRKVLDEDEIIIASLPQIWEIALGLSGFFHKNKEGILALTNKNLIFVPRYLFITPKEKERYFGDDKAKIEKISDYTESDLDEDVSENSKSLVISLNAITEVRITTSRKVNFLRISFMKGTKEKQHEFGVSKTITNYPQRQPLVFKNLDWSLWAGLIQSHLKN